MLVMVEDKKSNVGTTKTGLVGINCHGATKKHVIFLLNGCANAMTCGTCATSSLDTFPCYSHDT